MSIHMVWDRTDQSKLKGNIANRSSDFAKLYSAKHTFNTRAHGVEGKILAPFMVRSLQEH